MIKTTIETLTKVRALLARFFLGKFILTTDELLKLKKKNIEILRNDSDYTFKIGLTKNHKVDKFLSKWRGRYKVKGQFLILLKNVYLTSDWEIPITEDGEIILETSGKFGVLIGNIVSRSQENGYLLEYKILFFIFFLKLSKFLKINFFSIKTIKKPLFYLVPRHGFSLSAGPTFSHWIFEDLPRVKMYFRSLSHDKKIKIYFGKIKKDWQKITLSLLGVKDKQIFKFKKKLFTKVEKLFLCRLYYIHSSDIKFDPHGRSWVNKTIRASLAKKNYINDKKKIHKKIAFSRKFCSRRKIINEEKYLKILSDKGFNIVYPEKISELEKIKFSYFSKTILGLPSGSALANFIFSKQSKLIEIQNKKDFIPVWFLLSQELKIKYNLLFANFAEFSNDFRDNNYIIDNKNLFNKI